MTLIETLELMLEITETTDNVRADETLTDEEKTQLITDLLNA